MDMETLESTQSGQRGRKKERERDRMRGAEIKLLEGTSTRQPARSFYSREAKTEVGSFDQFVVVRSSSSSLSSAQMFMIQGRHLAMSNGFVPAQWGGRRNGGGSSGGYPRTERRGDRVKLKTKKNSNNGKHKAMPLR